MSTKDSLKTGDNEKPQDQENTGETIFVNNPHLGVKYTIGYDPGGDTPNLGNRDPEKFKRYTELNLEPTEHSCIMNEEERRERSRAVRDPGEMAEYKEQVSGKKENEGKVSYSEIDWDYIDAMSDRMDENTKYPPKNYEKGMDIKELAKATIRHARKILQPIEGDPESAVDHALAIGTNGMMIHYQVKNNKKS